MAILLFYYVRCFYLTDFTEEEQEDLYQGIMNGVTFSFFCVPGILLCVPAV